MTSGTRVNARRVGQTAEHELLQVFQGRSLKTTEVAEELRTTNLAEVNGRLEDARARGYLGRSEAGAWFVR